MMLIPCFLIYRRVGRKKLFLTDVCNKLHYYLLKIHHLKRSVIATIFICCKKLYNSGSSLPCDNLVKQCFWVTPFDVGRRRLLLILDQVKGGFGWFKLNYFGLQLIVKKALQLRSTDLTLG